MKKIQFLLYILISVTIISCEDVIELDLPEGDKRMVVDAWISNVSNEQNVKLSYTGPYFENIPMPRVTGATVKIYDDQGNIYNMIEEEPGLYRQYFLPRVGNYYTLEITTSEGVKYQSAPEKMNSVPELEDLYFEYKPKSIFEDEGYYVFFGLKDPSGERNFYRWKYYVNDVYQNASEYFIFENDELIDGSELSDIQFNYEPLIPGDHVKIEQHSITGSAFDFLYIVREQLTTGRGTFDAPPAPIRGNIINNNNPNETVLGYFGVSQVSVKEILIEDIE